MPIRQNHTCTARSFIKRSNAFFPVILALCIILFPNNIRAEVSLDLTDPNMLDLQKEVSGVVMDEGGNALPGATVQIKGTTIGAITDIDGKFRLNVEGYEDATLIVSFMGYEVQEIPINNLSEIEIQLVPDIQALGEIVVVGYGAVKKEDLTGAIESIKPEDLNTSAATNIGQQLQGRVSGLYVNSHNQDPGSTPVFALRGVSSLQGEGAAQPLIVIDGFPMTDNNALNTLNPNDIKQVSVLKDGSAVAIYGSRGANGVILITTKGGHEGKPKVNYSTRLSVQRLARDMDLMNAEEYTRFYFSLAHEPDNRLDDDVLIGTELTLDDINNTVNTDWQKEVINENDVAQEHNISLSGATNNLKYRLSAGFLDANNIVGPADYQRYNGSLKLDYEGYKIQISSSFNYAMESGESLSNRHGEFNQNIGDKLSYSYNNAVLFSPNTPVRDENGELSDHYMNHLFWLNNPFLNPEAFDGFSDIQNIRINLNLNYNFTDNISLQVRGGFNQTSSEYFRQRFLPEFDGQIPTGANISTGIERDFFAESFAKYNKSFDNHQIDFLAGGSINTQLRRGLFAEAEDFPAEDIGFYNIGAGLLNRELGSNWTERKIISAVSRLNYNFDNKYYLTISHRIDGATQFGENNKWGHFPSIAAAYKIDRESFFPDQSIVNAMKLKVSYGLAGNSAIPSFRTTRLIDFQPISIGANIENSLTWDGDYLPNPDLKWETSRIANFGIETGNEYFYLEMNVYRKNTKDLLIDRQVPTETGFSRITLNQGAMINKGIEGKIDLYLDLFGGSVKWSPGIWVAYNRNRITDMNGDEVLTNPVWLNNNNFGFSGRNSEGYPLGALWGYDFIGIWQEGEEAAALYGAEPGDPKFADIRGVDENGNITEGPDGRLTDEDKIFLGSTIPQTTAGFNSKFNYKNFEASFFFEGVFKKSVTNGSKVFYTFPFFNYGTNRTQEAINRWTTANPNNDVPSLLKAPTTELVTSDWTIEDASFVRLRDVTIAYTVKPEYVPWADNLRIYVSMSNLLTFTNYSGVNPDVWEYDGDFNLRPFSRTILFGLDLTF
ncbi:MAG: TonB-dependent receptor [Bacteroidota bacterium]